MYIQKRKKYDSRLSYLDKRKTKDWLHKHKPWQPYVAIGFPRNHFDFGCKQGRIQRTPHKKGASLPNPLLQIDAVWEMPIDLNRSWCMSIKSLNDSEDIYIEVHLLQNLKHETPIDQINGLLWIYKTHQNLFLSGLQIKPCSYPKIVYFFEKYLYFIIRWTVFTCNGWDCLSSSHHVCCGFLTKYV